MSDLFNSEPTRIIGALVAVVVLIIICAVAARRFGFGTFGGVVAARGRQPRLGVIELSALPDGRRRLVLIRRDNVEHLVMIGGPTDVVIESNIVRATPATARETAPARVTGDALPRAVPLAEGGMWPLQPEPLARPPRAPVAAPDDAEEETAWPAPPEIAPRAVAEREPVREAARESVRDSVPRAPSADRLAGLAADLSRNAAEAPPAPPPRRGVEPRRVPPPVPPVAPGPAIPASEEQNLAEMAQRLESVLQRPRPTGEPVAAAAPPPARAVETAPAEPAAPRAEPPVRPTPKPAPKPAPKAAFDSLEQEMASLLGRPSGKT